MTKINKLVFTLNENQKDLGSVYKWAYIQLLDLLKGRTHTLYSYCYRTDQQFQIVFFCFDNDEFFAEVMEHTEENLVERINTYSKWLSSLKRESLYIYKEQVELEKLNSQLFSTLFQKVMNKSIFLSSGQSLAYGITFLSAFIHKIDDKEELLKTLIKNNQEKQGFHSRYEQLVIEQEYNELFYSQYIDIEPIFSAETLHQSFIGGFMRKYQILDLAAEKKLSNALSILGNNIYYQGYILHSALQLISVLAE